MYYSMNNVSSDLNIIRAVAMQNKPRSALMMSNAQFLFVACSYINIKTLRLEEGEWHLMCDWQWTDSCLAQSKSTMPLGLKLGDSYLLLLLFNSSFYHH